MIQATLANIAEMIPGATVIERWQPVHIAGVNKDTRNMPTGILYVPIIGERFDGHDYVIEAIDKGAAASLWQRDHGQPPEGVPVVLVDHTLTALQQLASAYRSSLRVRVIGVTGSNGKTSTKDMIAAMASEQFVTLKTQGNLNNDIGMPLTLLEMDERTEIAVLEMGMSGFGEIELLTRIAKPDFAVITNIGEAHMEQLGSREGIAAAKMEIIRGLHEDGALIYDGDEPLLERQLEQTKPAIRLIRFGRTDKTDYYPTDIRVFGDHTGLTAVRGFGREAVRDLRIPYLGRHNAVNAMAAIAVADCLGLDEQAIHHGLAGMTPTSMRMETIHASSGAILLNDAYNASPTSMIAAIRFIDELETEGRKIAVLGDMLDLGPSSESYHRQIGKAISPESIDAVFTYGEMAAYIARECRERFGQGLVESFADKDRLIDRLHSAIVPGDTVLFKASRGMKLEDIVTSLS